ncbi:hypothetical protein KFE94_14325 [bacterium SCSIO 12643]|nr:hypothetical protein KFE94_14325 [bacterium SCSIO 12643]
MKSRILSLTLLLTCCFSIILYAQNGQIQYELIENRPQANLLELYVNPLDGKGANMGPGVTSRLRLNSRMMVEGNLMSAMYLNNYRSKYDGSTPDSFKNMGGIYFDATFNYAWRKKKVKLEGQNERFVLDRKYTPTVSGSETQTKYLDFQYNTVIERFIKVGGYYDNYPLDHNTLSGAGLVLGLFSNTSKSATIQVEDCTLKSRFDLRKGLNIFIGVPSYIDDTKANGSNIGFSITMGSTVMRSNSVKNRILQSYNVDFELGVKPGGVGFLGFKIGFPILRIGRLNLTPDNAEFKQIPIPKSKIKRWTLGV